MNFIYNEEEAKKKKEEFDEQCQRSVIEANKQNRKTQVLVWGVVAASVVILLAAIWVFCIFSMKIDDYMLGFVLAIMASIILPIFGLGIGKVWEGERWECPLYTDEAYTADVWYYIRTGNGKVLRRKIKEDYKGFEDLYVDLENEDGAVSVIKACSLKEVVSTKVGEETADLPRGLYLIPYHILTDNSFLDVEA